MTTSLDKIANGTTVVIKDISESALKIKLLEMGMMEGKNLSVLFRAPFGDPIAVDVGGYVLSLRKDEACLIQVAKI